MATQTFESRLQKALLDAAKNGANVTYYNFAGSTITGNIYINNGVPHVSKPTVEAPQKDTTVKAKTNKETNKQAVPVVVVPEVAEPVVFESQGYESNDDQEEVENETQDDSSQDDSQTSQEIQVTFDDDTTDDDTHVFKRLAQINKTLNSLNKIKLKKKLAKCGDLFKNEFNTAFILKVDSQDASDVCNFKDLQTFKDVVDLLSANL